MYETLKKLKGRINQGAWSKMVDQAKSRGKLTDEEYDSLVRE